MVKVDMMEVSQGYVDIVSACVEFAKMEASTKVDASIIPGTAYYRAQKIAGHSLEQFKKDFAAIFEGLSTGYRNNFYRLAEKELYDMDHLKSLAAILLGRVDFTESSSR